MHQVLEVHAAITSVVSTPSTPWLSRFVEDVRVVVPVAGGAMSVERLPDGRTSLVFRVLEEGRRAEVWLAGPRTRAQFRSKTGVARMVFLQFKPGWSAPLLGVPASSLTDQLVPLADIWGRSGAELNAELLVTRNLPELIERLSNALALRSQQSFEPASSLLARRAVRLLEGEEVRVERVAERLGVTSRHLRRAFTESVGIGPKDFARTVRLQRAVRLTATSQNWSRIAASAGYYDQAHLIAEFRELVGLTPSAFLRRASDRHVRPASDCHGAPT